MKNFNSLVSLIKKLSVEELKSLRKFLIYYYEKNNFSKGSELLELILKFNEPRAILIQKELYGKENLHAFNKLVDRLKEKILEVVIFDTNISKRYYPKRVQVLFDLKKKLIQCDVLSLKGLRDDGDMLCRRIISKAEKYEFHDIVMNALIIRQRFVNIRKKQVEIQNIQNGIEIAENKYKSVIHSQFIYNTIINKINNSSDSISYYNDLNISIKNLKKEYDKCKSDIINYYFLFLKTELYQIEENYSMAEDCLYKINLLLNNKSIFSENRKGTALLNISNIKIYLQKFDDAIINANESRKYFPNNIFNQSLVDEYLFYAYFYKGNYSEAENIVYRLVHLPEGNNILFSKNKWNYFNAVLSFVKGDFNKCINDLNNIPEIDKDKEEWNINKRLLMIISRIEIKEYDAVELKIASLEKFIKRSIKKRDIRVRYIYIIRILIKLINSNYNYKDAYNGRLKYFKLLANKSSDFKWKIKSPELINFIGWYNNKLN